MERKLPDVGEVPGSSRPRGHLASRYQSRHLQPTSRGEALIDSTQSRARIPARGSSPSTSFDHLRYPGASSFLRAGRAFGVRRGQCCHFRPAWNIAGPPGSKARRPGAFRRPFLACGRYRQPLQAGYSANSRQAVRRRMGKPPQHLLRRHLQNLSRSMAQSFKQPLGKPRLGLGGMLLDQRLWCALIERNRTALPDHAVAVGVEAERLYLPRRPDEDHAARPYPAARYRRPHPG